MSLITTMSPSSEYAMQSLVTTMSLSSEYAMQSLVTMKVNSKYLILNMQFFISRNHHGFEYKILNSELNRL